MKQTKILFILFLFVGINFSFGQRKEVKIRVDGLSCPFCAYGLEKKLNDIKGVENINIDFKNGLVTMNISGNKNINENEIKDKVKEAGFTPIKVEILDFPKSSENPKQ